MERVGHGRLHHGIVVELLRRLLKDKSEVHPLEGGPAEPAETPPAELPSGASSICGCSSRALQLRTSYRLASFAH